MSKITSPASYNAEATRARPLSQPHQIRWALILLWLSLIFTVALYITSLFSTLKTLPSDQFALGALLFGLAIPVALFAFDAFLNIKIAHKKNWARVTKLLVIILNVVLQLTVSPITSEFDIFAALVVNSLNFTAMIFLFVTSGRHWFDQTPGK